MSWFRRFEAWCEQDMSFTPGKGTALLVGLFAAKGFIDSVFTLIGLILDIVS